MPTDADLDACHGTTSAVPWNGKVQSVYRYVATLEYPYTVGCFHGADDYLVKPVRLAELTARLRALGRRGGPPAPATLQRGELELDPGRLTAMRGGRDLALTPREFSVLELLVRAEGRIVSAEELLERAWDENADPFTSVVRVIVSRLRRKLGAPDPIVTVVGRGYRI